MTTWLVVLGVGAASYVLRALPILLGGRWTRSPAVERVLAHAGTAAIAALIAGAVRHGSSGHVAPAPSQPRSGSSSPLAVPRWCVCSSSVAPRSP